MKNTILVAAMCTAVIFATPAYADSYEDRSDNAAVEGAMIGAMIGVIAGAIIASQAQPDPVVVYQPQRHYRRHGHYNRHHYTGRRHGYRSGGRVYGRHHR